MTKLYKIPKEWLLLIIIVILTSGIGIYDWNKTQLKDTSDGVLSEVEGTPPRWRDQNNAGGGISKEEAAVTVIVEYLPEKSTNNMVFQIVLDTHSVNLDAFDFQKEIALEKNGKSFSPNVISQEGSVHHRKAELAFNNMALPFVIVVNNLAGIPRREFKFTTL